MINGIINVYKEPGFTSHDVVAKLRGILKQKKIGHTGTLDPQAKGVLPICLGHGTKVTDILTENSKTYQVTGLLGVITDTQDVYGTILEKNRVKVEKEQVTRIIESFVGDYNQLPPMYSAIKVNGKRLYELARQGQIVERKRRQVRINDIKILDINLNSNEFTMIVDCSKGTYIRTLIHDIGEKLGCGASMKELLRKRVGIFEINNSIRLDEIEEMAKKDGIDSVLIRVDQLFPAYQKVMLLEEYSKLLYNGNSFTSQQIKNFNSPMNLEKVLVYDWKGQFMAIYQYHEKKKIFKPFKMFL